MSTWQWRKAGFGHSTRGMMSWGSYLVRIQEDVIRGHAGGDRRDLQIKKRGILTYHGKVTTATKPKEGTHTEVRDGVLYIYKTVVTTAPNATMTVGVVKEETQPPIDINPKTVL